MSHNNDEPHSPLTMNHVHRLTPSNGEPGSLLSDAPIYKESKDNVGDASTFAVRDEGDDQRLVAWMLERIRTVNARHRDPYWPTWRKEVEKMRRLDKRSRREIAELFAWANAHAFWQTNILSPATLRRQWDRLETARVKEGGAQVALRSDGLCVREKAGMRCCEKAVFRTRDGRDLCRQCHGEEERERARAQA